MVASVAGERTRGPTGLPYTYPLAAYRLPTAYRPPKPKPMAISCQLSATEWNGAALEFVSSELPRWPDYIIGRLLAHLIMITTYICCSMFPQPSNHPAI